jgi:hypothetical protein
MRQVDCYLSVTWGMLSVSVSYMKLDDGYLSFTSVRMMIICQLHEAGRRLSDSNIRGRMKVICQLH